MIAHDLRCGLRWLRANPGFTCTALFVLALGIGSTTATFCVVHTVALRPLPFHEPGRVVRIWSNQLRADIPFFSVSRADFEDWRAQSGTLLHLAAYDAQRAMVVNSGGGPDAVLGSRVTGDLFRLLGVAPARGRWISPAEARPGGAAVAVLGHGVWLRRFGGRTDVLGQSVIVDDAAFTVVGVMPPGFAIPNNPAELWLPLQAAVDPGERARRYLRVLGRLQPGAEIDDARTELTQIAADLGAQHPASNGFWGVSIRPIEDTVVSPELRRALLMLIAAVVVVLMVACANVAGLLLSRATARRREMAVRTALGAPRRVLVRQMLVEGALLAAASGVLGVVFAMWIVDALAQIAADTLPRADEVAFRPEVAAVAVAATAMTAIVFAVVPALDLSRVTLAALRSREWAGPAASRSRDVLVLGETALAVVLLVTAGLLVRSFVRLQDRDLGFEPDRLIVLQLAWPEGPTAPEHRWSVHVALVSRLESLPGVERVSGVASAPFSGRNPGNVFTIGGRVPRPGEPPPNADYRVVTPGYLRTMRIPILRGRDLDDADGPQSPAVVISETAARQYWTDGDPLGTEIQFDRHTLRIVGIAADARYAAIDAPTDALRPMMYLPHRLRPEAPLEIVVRTRAAPEPMVWSVRAAAASAAPEAPVSRITTMTDRLSEERGAHRFYTTVLGAFAWIALALAAAGLWGLIAYGVSRRTREIGIRVALGARPADVLRIAAARGLALAVAGLAIGLIGAAAVSRALERLLIGIGPMDAPTFAAIAMGFLAVATVASVLPARRALRIDPAEALRLE